MSTLQTLVGEPKKAPEKPAPPRIELGGGDYIDVIPYNAYFDVNCRHFLFWLYDKLRKDDLLRLYYPDVDDTDRSYPTFVRMFSSQATQVLLVVVRTPEEKGAEGDLVKDLVGIATWEKMQFGPSTLGHAGFIFLRDYWDHHTSVAAGKRILRYWFEDNPEKLDIAVGIIAKANVLANRFVSRLGWTKVGELPNCQQYGGEPSDAVIWQITRDAYEREK